MTRSNALPCADGSSGDDPGASRNCEQRGERDLEVAGGVPHRPAVRGDVLGPAAGEAVGLQLLLDRAVGEDAGAVLHRVTELVREHERDRERPDVGVEIGKRCASSYTTKLSRRQ